jgi:hypothetical protein
MARWMWSIHPFVFVCYIYAINTSHRVRPVGQIENLGGLLLILGLTNLGVTLLGEKGTKSPVGLRWTWARFWTVNRDEGTFTFQKYPWIYGIFLMWTHTWMSFTSHTFTSLPLVHTSNPDFWGNVFDLASYWFTSLLFIETFTRHNLRIWSSVDFWISQILILEFHRSRIPDFLRFVTSGLRRFKIPDLHRFATSGLRWFKIPDLRRFATSGLRGFKIPDLRRFAISGLRRFKIPDLHDV